MPLKIRLKNVKLCHVNILKPYYRPELLLILVEKRWRADGQLCGKRSGVPVRSGLKSALATFQKLMDMVVEGVKNCAIYIDDVVVFDSSWEDVKALVRGLDEDVLVVKLIKCELVHDSVYYLRCVVGHGKVSPSQVRMGNINKFKDPHCRRALQGLLGIIRHNRRFKRGYSNVPAPLTGILRSLKI